MSHAHKTHSIVNMRAPHKYHTRKICTSFLILLFFSSFMPLIRLSLCLIHRCACIAIGARGWRANVEIYSSDKSNPNGIQHTFWIRTIVRLYNHSVNVGWAKRKKIYIILESHPNECFWHTFLSNHWEIGVWDRILKSLIQNESQNYLLDPNPLELLKW